MAKGPKGFSEEEKDDLRTRLCAACEQSWALHGYKKTSVGELTTKIGISTGAFYLLYTSKEEMFCDTLQRVQERLKNGLREIVTAEPGSQGFIKALQWHFEEYDRAPFLYDFNNPDFLALVNKIPKEQVEQMEFDGLSSFYEVLDLSGVKLKVDREKVYAVCSTLLYTITLKERVPYDYHEMFEFLLNAAIKELFEA